MPSPDVAVAIATILTYGAPRAPDEPSDSPEEDDWWVEMQPGNYMAFHAPWDSGEYDTWASHCG